MEDLQIIQEENKAKKFNIKTAILKSKSLQF